MQCKYPSAVVVALAGLLSAVAAVAQEVSAPGGYQFFVTPYLWLASVHATTLTPLAHESEVNSWGAAQTPGAVSRVASPGCISASFAYSLVILPLTALATTGCVIRGTIKVNLITWFGLWQQS